MIHLLIVVALHGTLNYFGKGKVVTENNRVEDRLADNDDDFTLYDALRRENRDNNYLSITKLVLTILVMYGHSFDLRCVSASRIRTAVLCHYQAEHCYCRL